MSYVNYETYRKRGRGWQYLGERSAATMRGAALQTSYVENCRVVAVRPAGSTDKRYVYRFAQPAAVHHGQ
jgi:hypothetical protein